MSRLNCAACRHRINSMSDAIDWLRTAAICRDKPAPTMMRLTTPKVIAHLVFGLYMV